MSKIMERVKGKSILFWLFLFLSIIVVLGSIFDAVTTYFALKIQGTYESNPLMRYIINDWGWFAFFAVKVLLYPYLVLPLKFCPMYYLINFGVKNKVQIIGMLIMFVVLTVYLFLAYTFLMPSLGNLQHIL